jgi:D-3-phosphoglycerate dehydrogenase
MDNIDVDYAKSKGCRKINGLLIIIRIYGRVGFAFISGSDLCIDSNRNMPLEGDVPTLTALKKAYANGIELRGKTLGIRHWPYWSGYRKKWRLTRNESYCCR